MANEQNLKPFQKGKEKTGGVKKGYVHPATLIKQMMAMEFPTPEALKELMPNAKYTIQEIMTMAQAVKAMKGVEKSYELLTDRVAGKPTQPISGDQDLGPIQIKVDM